MPAKPKLKVTSLSSSARLEGPWGSMELRTDQAKGTLALARHEDPGSLWSGDGGPHAVFSIPQDCPIVGLKPGDKKPNMKFPNDFLDFLIAHPEFAPKWMREANSVFFYETEPPAKSEGGLVMVRGITFAFGTPRRELRLDRAFGPHDRIAMFSSDDPMSYEIVDAAN